MKFKITKYIISFSIIVTICIGIIFAATKQVKADGANIRYIITSAGADETSVGINYQVDKEPLLGLPLPDESCSQTDIISLVDTIINTKDKYFKFNTI